jgi:hypothetical protein
MHTDSGGFALKSLASTFRSFEREREREEMENERLLERERHQMEQIRELDLEELQVEEVDGLHDSSDDDLDAT